LEPSNKADLMTKLKSYNGELIIERGGTKKISVKELKEGASGREGMFGLSTRFIEKAIDEALVKSEHNCLNPISVKESLMAAVEKGDFTDDEKKKFLAFLTDTLHKDFLQILEKEIVKAGVHAFDEQAQALFDNYIDHAEAFVNKTKIKDSVTGEELEPDEVSMRSIEEQLGLSGDAAKGFRQDVISFCAQAWRRKQAIDWKSYVPLKQAIENKIMAATSEFVRVVMKSRARGQKEVQKYNEIVTLMKAMGYECDHCIDMILKFAHNHLWRD
jgi:serine protein kinase